MKRFLSQIDDLFSLSFCLGKKLRCAAPGVGDVTHHIIGLPQHPSVPVENGKASGHRLQPVRVNRIFWLREINAAKLIVITISFE